MGTQQTDARREESLGQNKKVAVYIRVGTREQMDPKAAEEQAQRIKAYCRDFALEPPFGYVRKNGVIKLDRKNAPRLKKLFRKRGVFA